MARFTVKGKNIPLNVKNTGMETSSLNIKTSDNWALFKHTERPLLLAGPCSAESEEQVLATASRLQKIGINVFRAGLWKPRTRPNCFEGVGEKGLKWLVKVQRLQGMKVGTEVANSHHVEECLKAGIDFLWIGARTTANPFAVQEIAESLRGTDIPVLVKNPINPDIELWIGALERLNLVGISRLGAIHRGFSAYNNLKYRNMPQWQIPIELKRRIKTLPLFCDPSHIGGKREYIQEIAQKSMDLGFDGLMIESHTSPEQALSDARQQVTPERLEQIIEHLVIRTTQVQADDMVIEDLRERIDYLDNTIMETLVSRMKVIEEIGQYKKSKNLSIFQPERWEKILTHVTEEAHKNNLPQELVERVFKAIHQASIDRQTEIMNE